MNSKSLTIYAVITCVLLSLINLERAIAQDADGSHKSRIPRAMQGNAMTEKLSASPQFTSPIRIKSGSTDMKVDTYTSVPCAVDWNQDGKKDLLVGCFFNGNVYFFNNSGTDAVPNFTTGTKLKADGQEISVAYG